MIQSEAALVLKKFRALKLNSFKEFVNFFMNNALMDCYICELLKFCALFVLVFLIFVEYLLATCREWPARSHER